jgi:GNAT superfamily N-acetyltransferase
MSEERVWEDVSPGRDDLGFQDWLTWETAFGEFGEPGYSEKVVGIGAAHIFGHTSHVDVRFTLLRNYDGLLVCVHGCYIDNDIQKPFALLVHPDHQRQGIGTMVMDYVRERFEVERGHEFTYEESLRNNEFTTSTAAFANKYIKNIYSKESNQ